MLKEASDEFKNPGMNIKLCLKKDSLVDYGVFEKKCKTHFRYFRFFFRFEKQILHLLGNLLILIGYLF